MIVIERQRIFSVKNINRGNDRIYELVDLSYGDRLSLIIIQRILSIIFT